MGEICGKGVKAGKTQRFGREMAFECGQKLCVGSRKVSPGKRKKWRRSSTDRLGPNSGAHVMLTDISKCSRYLDEATFVPDSISLVLPWAQCFSW